MRHILKQTAFLALSVVILYGLILGLTLVLVPRPEQNAGLDTTLASKTLFTTAPKYLYYNRSSIGRSGPQIVVLGNSNAAAGFKQRELQKLFPQATVHNLAVGGADASEVRQEWELVRDMQTPLARANTVFVIGLWYGMFVDDRIRWYNMRHGQEHHPGDTDIDVERYRYGFERRTDDGPKAVVPPKLLDVGVTLIHPLLAMDHVMRASSAHVKVVLFKHAEEPTEDEANAAVVDEPQRSAYLKYWVDYMAGAPHLSQVPFETMAQMVTDIVKDGSSVVLVDMPLPPWHRDGSPYTTDYRHGLDALRAQFSGQPQVKFLEVHTGDPILDFCDEVHPKPRVTPAWSAQLAEVLRPLIKPAVPPTTAASGS